MSTTHLITGCTGFVGGALALELLERTDDRLLCVVRANAHQTAQERMAQSLQAAAEAYELKHLLPAVSERCTAVEGDLLRPRCGIGPEQLGVVGRIWHCAASLQYEDKHRDGIWATNVDGTAHVLDLACSLGHPAFVYVSTAYVAGDRSGEILERPVPENGSHNHNNWYERSKVAAEALVQGSGLADWRIARPSIVIGHSQTLRATSFTGMYGFIRGFRRFDDKVSEKLGGFLRFRPIRFLAEPDCSMNLIPIDAVAYALVRVGLAPAGDTRYFQLVNTTPPRLGDSLALLCSELGLAAPDFAMTRAELSAIDEQLDEELGFYRSYLYNSKRFDAACTLMHTESGRLAWKLEPDALLPYVRWYVDFLDATRGKVAA